MRHHGFYWSALDHGAPRSVKLASLVAAAAIVVIVAAPVLAVAAAMFA